MRTATAAFVVFALAALIGGGALLNETGGTLLDILGLR